MLEVILSGILGYVLGAIPTGMLICRVLHREDVRQHGSGHIGGLNVSRVAGVWAGVLTAVVDSSLGLAAVALATLLTGDPWAAMAAGVMAVVGHNWSVFIRFGGGIGLSTLTGTLLCLAPALTLSALVGLAIVWLALVKFLHFHRARTTILVMILVGPLLWALGMTPAGILLGVLGGVAVIVKTAPDWSRKDE